MIRTLSLILTILILSCGAPQAIPSNFEYAEEDCLLHEDGSHCPTCKGCSVCRVPTDAEGVEYYEEARVVQTPIDCPEEDIDGDGKITWHYCYLWDHCRRAPQNCVGTKERAKKKRAPIQVLPPNFTF